MTNLLTNGSFEMGPESSAYPVLDPGSTEIKGWTVTRASVDYIGRDWTCSNGKRCLDVTGTPGYEGIKQTFSTTPGQRYLVAFDLSGNPEGEPQVKKLAVTAAEQDFEASFDIAKHGYEVEWEHVIWSFTAKDTSTTIEFYSRDTVGNMYGPLLDNVSVTPLISIVEK